MDIRRFDDHEIAAIGHFPWWKVTHPQPGPELRDAVLELNRAIDEATRRGSVSPMRADAAIKALVGVFARPGVIKVINAFDTGREITLVQRDAAVTDEQENAVRLVEEIFGNEDIATAIVAAWRSNGSKERDELIELLTDPLSHRHPSARGVRPEESRIGGLDLGGGIALDEKDSAASDRTFP
jgi:hypothetical protein